MSGLWKDTDIDVIARLQREDPSIQNYKERDGPTVRGDQEASFEEERNALYRIYKHTMANKGRAVRQILYRSHCYPR